MTSENTEKYKTFSVLLRKQIRKVDEDRNEDFKAISCKIKVIDSARFMTKLIIKSFQ